MKSVCCVALLGLAAILALPADAEAGAVDFDDILSAPGTGTSWLPDRYLLTEETLFSAPVGSLYSWRDPSPGYGGQDVATTPPVYVYGGGLGNASGPIGFAFFVGGNLGMPGVTDQVTFDVADYVHPNDEARTWSWEARDVGGSVIAFGNGTASRVPVVITTATPMIHSVMFTPSGDTEGIDSVVFGPVSAPVSVPTPAAFAPGLLVLVGALLRRRMRRRS